MKDKLQCNKNEKDKEKERERLIKELEERRDKASYVFDDSGIQFEN